MARPSRRLSADDWLDAGLEALATKGPQALQAQPLAREMSTTKGSFYWHFKDISDFRARLLARWRDRALAALEARGDAETVSDRLYRIARPEPTEGAIRGMAGSDHTAKHVVAEVDVARRAALAGELAALGLTNPEFATILQAAVIGMEALGDAAPMSTLMAAILALQEA